MKTLEIYRDAQRRFRWRVRARNGRIQATGAEGYNRLAKCIEAAESVLRVEIVDGKVIGWGYDSYFNKGDTFKQMNLRMPEP